MRLQHGCTETLLKHCRTSASNAPKGGEPVSKARLYHLAVVASLVIFALLAARQMMPFGPYDGAD